MTDTLDTKLGTTRAGERTRIWLQGSRLPEHGFRSGTYFLKRWHAASLTITHCTKADYDMMPRDQRGKVSGDKVRPVIDVTGEIVARTFQDTHVSARFTQGRIVITDAFEAGRE